MDLDVAAGRPQHAHEGIAEDRVAQMPDMGGLVRIDIGVLDDDLLAGRRNRAFYALQQLSSEVAPVQPDVQITIARDLDSRHTLNRSQPR